MKIGNYMIPKEADSFSRDIEGNRIIIEYCPRGKDDFYCKQTCCMEEIPKPGDLSVFWDDECPDKAIVSQLKQFEYINGEKAYQATSDVWYGNAIRFRSGNQYESIMKTRPV